MNKIKKGDKVVVIAGKSKGETATVIAILDGGEKVLLDGVNFAKKHVKANPNTGDRGGIVNKPMPIHRSNVMLLDPTTLKPSRVGIQILADGQKVRVYKSSKQLVEVAK